MEDIIVPVAFFAIVPAILLVIGYWGHKNRREAQETLRKIVDKGESLTPELILAVGAKPGKRGKFSDLKTGVVLIALAIASVIFGRTMQAVSGDHEPMAVFAGLAAFPALIGLSYLGFHFFAREDKADA